MKRYFIKIIATSTDRNPNFAGTVVSYVYGKKEEMVARQPIEDPKGYCKYDHTYDLTHDRMTVEEYGFTSRGRAQRVAREIHDAPDQYGFWENRVSVIEVEI